MELNRSYRDALAPTGPASADAESERKSARRAEDARHRPNGLRIGEWVEVRSREEILGTLDERGRLDGMPFMPEMLAFCGHRFRVYKLAHKTCDTVVLGSVRSLERTVHLETRCDGSGHGGCQANCLLYWREEWLRPASQSDGRTADAPAERSGPRPRGCSDGGVTPGSGCTESSLRQATFSTDPVDGKAVYSCQATRLHDFTQPLNPYHLPTYIRDYTSGNVSFGTWVQGIVYINYQRLINLGIGWGPVLRWIYDAWQRLVGGLPYPRHAGLIPAGQPTPTAALDLKEGEWVRVKEYKEILATCTTDLKNRGMSFDGEQVPYCGGTFKVLRRVEQIIDERTGKMIRMKSPCIMLEGVVCKGHYSECRMFCPREIPSYWREIWLERVKAPDGPESN